MLDNPMGIEFDRSKTLVVFGENDNLIEQVLKSKFDNKFSRRYRTGKIKTVPYTLFQKVGIQFEKPTEVNRIITTWLE
jgi:hypothetical protein